MVPICALKSYWLAGPGNEQNPENIFARSDCWVEDWLVIQPAEDSILWGWLPLLLARVVVSADRCHDDYQALMMLRIVILTMIIFM